MKRFILKLVLFSFMAILVLTIGVVIGSAVVSRQNFENHQTESNTLVMKEGHHYDLGMLGISHARNFSRHGNHQCFENSAGRDFLNLGQGRGKCGVNEQLFYLQYAYSKGVKIDTLMYVLSPPMVFGDYLNKASETFDNEVFDLGFINQYLSFYGDNKRERLFSYLKHKLHPNWWMSKPVSSDRKVEALSELDPAVVKLGFESAYKDSSLTEAFDKNVEIILRTQELAAKNDTHVIYFIPPALFGQWPGHQDCLDFAYGLKNEYQVDVYDFSESVKEPKYYYDHHHLNSEGVEYFLEEYLKDLFEN